MQFNSRTKTIKLTVQEQRRLKEAMMYASDIARIAPQESTAHAVADEAAERIGQLLELGKEIDLTAPEEPDEQEDESTPPTRKRA